MLTLSLMSLGGHFEYNLRGFVLVTHFGFHLKVENSELCHNYITNAQYQSDLAATRQPFCFLKTFITLKLMVCIPFHLCHLNSLLALNFKSP